MVIHQHDQMFEDWHDARLTSLMSARIVHNGFTQYSCKSLQARDIEGKLQLKKHNYATDEESMPIMRTLSAGVC
jgi:hypothetical protein